MTFALLEERCRRFIELMHEGSLAIDQHDVEAVERVSLASEALLAQIEQGWYLVLGDSERPEGDLEGLRQLMREALDRSQENQRRLAWWTEQTRDSLRTVRHGETALMGYAGSPAMGSGYLSATA